MNPFFLHHILITMATSVCLIACNSHRPLPAGDPDRGGLSVPEGFDVLVVADSTGRARHLTVRNNGDIYVKLRASDSLRGSVLALRDRDGDGKIDSTVRFGGIPGESRIYGAGMTIHQGQLYFSSATNVYRYPLKPGELVPQGKPEVVLEDDHAHGDHWHITKPVSFDDQGHMYIPFGGPSNACQDLEATPNGASGGVGLDPCPELEEHGGIWQFDASKTGLKQSDGERIATGIRSVVAMDWNPTDKQLYLVMHGRDNLYSLYPDRFDPWQSAVLPAEEFLRISPGADYGWPYCYYDQIQGKKVLAPEYGGDGEMIGRCEGKDLPLLGFPGHWAPNDLLFYQGDQFPSRYKQGAFVAFHGSTNRAPYPQAGYFVAFVPFVDGEPTGEVEVFADGFAGRDTLVNTRDADFRPMGLAEGPDGSLYVAESNTGKIWRIMFKGDRVNFGEEELASMEAHQQLLHIKTPDPELDNLQKHLADGERLYNTFCGTCHQRDGEGVPGRFPPIRETRWVTGDTEELIALTLGGMQGEIEVKGEVYNGVMPPHAFLPDAELAIILSYVRKTFGPGLSEISEKTVSQIRGKLDREQ